MGLEGKGGEKKRGRDSERPGEVCFTDLGDGSTPVSHVYTIFEALLCREEISHCIKTHSVLQSMQEIFWNVLSVNITLG